jgi:hypothetical protein
MRMRYICIVICGLSCPTIFLHIISQQYDFRKKKVFEHKIGVLILSTNFFWNISHSTKNSAMYDHKCIFVFK